MVAPDDVRQKLEAGRGAAIGRLRGLADRLAALPLEDVGEVLAWLHPLLGSAPIWLRRRREPVI
jgi:hypothetical protein